MLLLYSVFSNLIISIFTDKIIALSILFGALIKFINTIFLDNTIDFNYQIPDVGILIIMFLVGANIDFKSLKKNIFTINIAIVATILAALCIVPIVKSTLDISVQNSILIAAILSTSSTVICHQLLSVGGRMITDYGQLSLLCTVAQDLIGIIVVIIVHSKTIHKTVSLTTMSISYSILALVCLIFYFAREKLDKMIENISDNIYTKRYSTLVFCGAIILNFVSVELEEFGISKEILLLIAGAILSKIAHRIEWQIGAIENIFLGCVFILSGYNIDATQLFNNLDKVLTLLLYCSIIKFVFLYISLSTMQSDHESNIRSALILSSFSELVYFVCLMIPELDESKSTILIASTTMSIVITPIIFGFVSDMFDNLRKKSIGIAKYAAKLHVDKLKKYVLFIGINNNTDNIASKLSERLIQIIAIDNNIDKVIAYKNKNYFFMDAKMFETYEAIEVQKIITIIISIRKVSNSIEILQLLNKIPVNKKVYIICSKNDFKDVISNGGNPIIINPKDIEASTDELVAEVIKNIEEEQLNI